MQTRRKSVTLAPAGDLAKFTRPHPVGPAFSAEIRFGFWGPIVPQTRVFRDPFRRNIVCLLKRKSLQSLGQFIVYNGNVHRFRALPGHAVAKVVVVVVVETPH